MRAAIAEHLRVARGVISGADQVLVDAICGPPVVNSCRRGRVIDWSAQPDPNWPFRAAHPLVMIAGDETCRIAHLGEQFPRYAPGLRHRTRIGTVHTVAPGVYTADGLNPVFQAT